MFDFYQKLFKGKEKAKETKLDIPVAELPKVNADAMEELRHDAEEVLAAYEDSRKRVGELEARDAAIKDLFKKRGWCHKFRDVNTGEIYEVEVGDGETFDKMMGDKNMQLVFG